MDGSMTDIDNQIINEAPEPALPAPDWGKGVNTKTNEEQKMQNIAQTYSEYRPCSIPNPKIEAFLGGFAESRNIPLDISVLPDFLQDYVTTAAEHTDAIPGSLITALLPHIAVNIGNRVYIENKGKRHSARIWAILLGESGISRKSTSIRLASRTMCRYEESLKDLAKNERDKKMLITNSTTNAKLMSLLSVKPDLLMSYEEISQLFSNTQQNFNSGMRANLTSLFDGDSKSFSNMDRTEHIDNPSLSIIGASTPSWFYPFFQNEAEQGSGFLQRFIYNVIAGDPSQLHTTWGDEEANYEKLYAYDDIYETFRRIPGSFKLNVGNEAGYRWAEEHNAAMDRIAKEDDTDLRAYAVRTYNNLFFSLLISFTLMEKNVQLAEAIDNDSCADFFKALKVEMHTAEQALYLCDYYLANARPMICMIKEAGSMKKQRRILRHLMEQPNFSETHSNLMNKRGLDSIEIAECMKNLIERGFVEQSSVGEGKKKAKLYSLIVSSTDDLYSNIA
jgi:hypothetical protein